MTVLANLRSGADSGRAPLLADSRAAEATLASVPCLGRALPPERSLGSSPRARSRPTASTRRHACRQLVRRLTRAYATRQTRRPRATSRSAASSSLPRPELRCRCRSDPGASGWLLPLGDSGSAPQRWPGRISTIAMSPLGSSHASRRIDQSDRRGHGRRVIPSRAMRSRARPASRDCWPSKAIVRRRLPGRLLLGDTGSECTPGKRLLQV
jgi:hypothetical protein